METYTHRSIKHCLDMIAPFEGSEHQIKDGQLQFYRFMVSLYRNMYEDPEKYMVFPKPYEEYIAKPKGKKEKEHTSNSRESTLRNTFQQAIQFYALYFYNLGVNCDGIDEKDGSLAIAKEKYFDVLNRMNSIHDSKYNAERYEVLSQLGVRTYENDDKVSITIMGYSNAMSGVQYLCKAPDSKYKWMNFLRLDYKNAYSPIPTVDDICKTLPLERAELVGILEDNLSDFKIKKKIRPLRGIVSDFKWKVEYSYKGKNICGFYADNSYFMLCIYFNNFQNITDFAADLYAEDIKLFQWFKKQFPERLCKCPSNRRVYFGDESRRICGMSNRAEIVDPDNNDIENALYILKKYRKIG